MDIEQLKKEKDADYVLFIKYLQMSPRSIPQLAIELALPIKKIRAVSKINKWQERANNYDKYTAAYFAERQKNAIATLADDLANEDYEVRKISYALVKNILIKYLLKEQSQETTQIKISDIDRLANLFNNTKAQEISEQHVDYTDLSDEELAELKKLASKIKQ